MNSSLSLFLLFLRPNDIALAAVASNNVITLNKVRLFLKN